METITRQANLDDLKDIKWFVDFWLSGRGKKYNAPNVANDIFISTSQHIRYIDKYKTYIVTLEGQIIAWAVIQKDGSLIHLLVDGYCRGKHIGSDLLAFLKPKKVHSKSNQSTGNPAKFYERQGYIKTGTKQSRRRIDIDKIDPDRKAIIDIFEREQLCQTHQHA